MTASATDKARVRRMVNEPDETTYTDEDIAEAIERYPAVDARGEDPWVESTTTPGTLEENEDWTATYDLNAAASDLWAEKAAVLAQDYDFEADGGSYTRSQANAQAMRMSRHYSARRNPRTISLRPEPAPTTSEDLSN